MAALVGELLARPASADITAFLGASTTPATRQVRGIAASIGLIVIAFEFEYASTVEDPAAGAPALKTGSGNLLLQTPIALFGVRPYFTTGGGIYRERLGVREDTGLALNTGGGVKVSLAGPLEVRVDYRLFRLRSTALNSPSHRIYTGLNLRF